MPVDLFIAYRIQKKVEESLKQKKDKELVQINNKNNNKIKNINVKNECFNCGQNRLWCLCDYSILSPL